MLDKSMASDIIISTIYRILKVSIGTGGYTSEGGWGQHILAKVELTFDPRGAELALLP